MVNHTIINVCLTGLHSIFNSFYFRFWNIDLNHSAFFLLDFFSHFFTHFEENLGCDAFETQSSLAQFRWVWMGMWTLESQKCIFNHKFTNVNCCLLIHLNRNHRSINKKMPIMKNTNIQLGPQNTIKSTGNFVCTV